MKGKERVQQLVVAEFLGRLVEQAAREWSYNGVQSARWAIDFAMVKSDITQERYVALVEMALMAQEKVLSGVGAPR